MLQQMRQQRCRDRSDNLCMESLSRRHPMVTLSCNLSNLEGRWGCLHIGKLEGSLRAYELTLRTGSPKRQ
jgi:hypothetical protein